MQRLDLCLMATCLDERAEEQCEVLFIRGETEDVQVTDGDLSQWLLVFDGPSLLT